MISPLAILRKRVLSGAVIALLPAVAGAQVAWTDWTSLGAGTVTGTLSFAGSPPVDVTFSGGYAFAQTGCGTNYWTTPATYTGPGVPNAPGNCEIIALAGGTTKTVTFSQAVVNPLIALVSWNSQPSVPFSGPLEIVDQGCGYFGCGSISVAGNEMQARDEAHGTVRLLGTYTSFTFTDAPEYWHGITIGAEGLAPLAAVPEPATVALTATGLLALAGIARRRRS